MISFFRIFYCKEFFVGTILVNLFLPAAHANVDDMSNKSLEARLHSIYEKHYSREVLDSDWFKVIQSVQEQSYSVKKGDTLWGISLVYFGDGNYWSKLWSVNKNITNPHLIYVGDDLRFTTGSYSQPPSISVSKANQSLSSAIPAGGEDSEASVNSDEGVDEEAVAKAEAEESGKDIEEVKAQSGKNSGLNGPNPLPDFFKPPYDKSKRTQNLTSIEARPEVVPITDITLTQEVLSSPPQILCRVKSVGHDRVIMAEDNRLILECRDQSPSIGSTLSILDADIQEIDDGHIVKVLAVIKVVSQVDKGLFEANVIHQYDGILNKSIVSPYVPNTVSIDDTGEVKALPVKILNADSKSIWTTGDFLFLKMKGTPGNVGDILTFSNKFDTNINSYLRTALVKIVSTQGKYATGVVINSSNALREDSLSVSTGSANGTL